MLFFSTFMLFIEQLIECMVGNNPAATTHTDCPFQPHSDTQSPRVTQEKLAS